LNMSNTRLLLAIAAILLCAARSPPAAIAPHGHAPHAVAPPSPRVLPSRPVVVVALPPQRRPTVVVLTPLAAAPVHPEATRPAQQPRSDCPLRCGS